MAGCTIEPSASVPIHTGVKPEATATAEPEDEPAGVCCAWSGSAAHFGYLEFHLSRCDPAFVQGIDAAVHVRRLSLQIVSCGQREYSMFLVIAYLASHCRPPSSDSIIFTVSSFLCVLWSELE